MPYLRLTELSDHELNLSVSSMQDLAHHSGIKTTVNLQLGPEARGKLLTEVRAFYLESEGGATHSELRIDLPKEWILFFKLRESESRILAAHPEKDTWVVTLALVKEHALQLLAAIEGSPKVLTQNLFPLGQVSNAEVCFEHFSKVLPAEQD